MRTTAVAAVLLVGSCDALVAHSLSHGLAHPLHQARAVQRTGRSHLKMDLSPALRTITSTTSTRLPALRFAYGACAVSTTAAWAATSCRSLAGTSAALSQIPTALAVAQSLALMPLVWASYAALSMGCKAGWARLRKPTYRRLNFGLGMACAWSLVCVVWAPLVSIANWWVLLRPSNWGLLQTLSGSTAYPAAFQLFCGAAYLPTIAVCMFAWLKTRPEPSDTVAMDLAKEELSEGTNEYHALALAFFTFAALSLGPFPCADIPSGLGANLARANGAWLWFASVVCGTLKDAAERGGLYLPASIRLNRGMTTVALANLGLVAARFVHVKRVPEAAALYPAVLSRPSVVAAVVVVYTLALVTSLGVDPDEANSSGGAPSSSGREVGLNAEGKWQLIKADEEGGGN